MQLGTAFIELLPDLSGFAKKTDDGLKKAAPKPVEVGLKPDFAKLAGDLAAGTAKAAPPPVTFPVYADFKDATAEAKKAGTEAGKEFSDGFDKAADSSKEAGAGLDAVATKADGLATRASTAAGGIGDLAGALEAQGLISADTAASAELVSSSIMGVAGVADLSVIAMEGLKAIQASDIVQKGIQIGQNIALKAAQIAATVATGAQAAAQWALNAALNANPIGIVIGVLALLVGAIILAYNNSETFRNIVQTVWKGIQGAISFAWEKVIKPVFDALSWFFTEGAPKALNAFLSANDRVVKGVAGAIRGFWFERVKPVLDAVVGFFTRTLPGAADSLRRGVVDAFLGIHRKIMGIWSDNIKPILDRVVSFFKTTIPVAVRHMRDKFGEFFNGLKAKAAEPINFVINTVYNDGLRKMLNLIPGVNLAEAAPIKLKDGGVLPGYTPGRDIHKFWSPTGGGLELSGGEAIMRPEFTAAMGGAAGIAALNSAARKGNKELVSVLLGGSQAHAQGGLVSFKGGTFTEQFAQVLRNVSKQQDFTLFQGGFRPTTSYSGTSHAGDAADVGPVSASLVQLFRAAGAAAWDRTNMGNWAPHIHMVPLPGYGRPGGSGVWQAQDYLNGGNGLGGRDNGLGSGSQPNVSGGNFIGDFFSAITSLPGMLDDLRAKIDGMTGSAWFKLMQDAVRSVMGGAVDWINEKIPGDGPLPHFANGGVAIKGGWARVGENGAETVYLPGGAHVRPGTGGARILEGTVALDMSRSEAHIRLLIADEQGQDRAFATTLARMGD